MLKRSWRSSKFTPGSYLLDSLQQGLDGQSRKLRIDNTPAAQPDRASDGLPPMVSVCACSSDRKSIGREAPMVTE